jgi:hydroxymethylglutaryl-CoA reductase (NADPH)
MPGVPAFILRRLYVKGSLRNTANGWQFTLKNTLGSGYAKGLLPLKVDDSREIPMEHTSFEQEGTRTSFDEVNEHNTFGLQMNKEIDVQITGDQLPIGSRTIYFGAIVPGIGRIGFDFTDEIIAGNG